MRNYWENLAVVMEGEWEPANEFELVEGNSENLDLAEGLDKNSEAWQSRIWWGSTAMVEQGRFWGKILEKLNLWGKSSPNNRWAIEDAKNILRVQGILKMYFAEDYRFYENADFPENIEFVRQINECRKILMLMFGAYSFAETKNGQLIFQQGKAGFWNKRINEFIEFGKNKPDKVDLEEKNC